MHSSIRFPAVALLLVLACACVGIDRGAPRPAEVATKSPGPPAHAPAHGYRRNHPQEGTALRYDSGLGVYVVVDTPDCWWLDGGYFRIRDGAWSTGARLSGPWTVIAVEAVPEGLRGYTRKKNGKGNVPASRKR
jgi:hypothetical protein